MKEWLCCCIVHLCFTILKCFINCVDKFNALFSGFNIFTLKGGTVVHDSKGCTVPQIVSQSLFCDCGGTRWASYVVFVMDKEALGTSLALECLGFNVYQFYCYKRNPVCMWSI